MKENSSFEKLKENIIDIIAEQQAKLGYLKEPVRLYYPLSSLKHLTGMDAAAEQMEQELQAFSKYVKDTLGDVTVSHVGERFCFLCPPTASEYVHLQADKNAFIYELVKLLSKHGTTMQEVLALFEKQQQPYETEKIADGEFDIAIHFINAKDRYYYCFKDEGCHLIYHRFLPEDYQEL